LDGIFDVQLAKGSLCGYDKAATMTRALHSLQDYAEESRKQESGGTLATKQLRCLFAQFRSDRGNRRLSQIVQPTEGFQAKPNRDDVLELASPKV
jgi:hypothetical protein